VKPILSPKERVEYEVRKLKERLFKGLRFSDYAWVEKEIEESYALILSSVEIQEIQARAEELKAQERALAERERRMENWDFRVMALGNHLNDVKGFIQRGNLSGAVELLELLPCFARTGSFYEETKEAT
jgi:hypothetical protein